MDNDYEDEIESINEEQDEEETEQEPNETQLRSKISKVINNNEEQDIELDDDDDEDDDEDDDNEIDGEEEDIDAEDEDDIFEETDRNNDENKSKRKQNINIRSSFNDLDDISNDDDDDDDDDENYLQKFDEKTQQNIISEYHPELQTHNYTEVEILSRVVRDGEGNIIDPLHQTLPFITRYERAKILGERAKQINAGAPIFVEVEPSVIDGYLIALKEFEEKKIPFIIKRPLPNGGCEYWKFKDLEII